MTTKKVIDILKDMKVKIDIPRAAKTQLGKNEALEIAIAKLKETVVTHASGNTTINKTTKVTGKGQVYFVNKLTKEYA